MREKSLENERGNQRRRNYALQRPAAHAYRILLFATDLLVPTLCVGMQPERSAFRLRWNSPF